MNAPMTPERFRHQLEQELADLPEDPGPAVAVAAGRRLLRRRRGLALGTAALVLGLGGGAWTVLPDPPGDVSLLSDPTASIMSDATLERACRQQWRSDTPPSSVREFWRSERPELMARDTLGSVTVAAYASADGRWWAECDITEGPTPEFSSIWTVYDNQERDTGFQSGTRPACLGPEGQVEPDCRAFLLRVVDHLPEEVASVRFVLADGRTIDRRTTEGYYALVTEYELPPGQERDYFEPVARISYLAADGTPLAAQAMNGSGEGPDGESVGDLPVLAAYPGCGAEARE